MGRGHYERSADALWAHPSSQVPSCKGGIVRDIFDVDKICIDAVASKILPERFEKLFCALSHHGLHGGELILPPLDRTSLSGVEVAPMPVNECFKPALFHVAASADLHPTHGARSRHRGGLRSMRISDGRCVSTRRSA